ncbi:MAG: putative DNA binding domain-containing protein [Gammaproteobacteria bacterium]|nr:putative DNA binding domain-containing protein [Gammaproteobacteria bacterium]MCY4276141.1 putative DNA binding domain-containing protein [Gammaproteobacteria bacterium]
METEELLSIIARGEDSTHQFKANAKNPESLAQEMVAFSNSSGGVILVGVTDNGDIEGLTNDDMRRLNQLVSNAATDHIRPPISPLTQNFSLPDGMVMVLEVREGISKPYMDKNLHVYVKSGADKRKVTAREELLRMFQDVALVHADRILVPNSSIEDLDKDYFNLFFENEYETKVEDQNISYEQLLENMNLAKDGKLNNSGALLFASRPYYLLPAFIVKAVAFPSVDIENESYIDSQDINGKLSDIFQKSLGFVLANIRHVQNDQGFNSLGQPEIPRIVLIEVIVNALIHRNYFISAPIKILIFSDRVEIISPGSLPNNLTVENIKMGVSNNRNPIMASYAPKLLPYRGFGSGIKRSLKEFPHIEFVDNKEAELFTVIIRRICS